MSDLFDDDLFTDVDTESGDGFSEGRGGFVEKDDLIGRLLMINPYTWGTRAGQQGDYVWVETDTFALDGQVTEMIPEIPFHVIKFQWTGVHLVDCLERKLRLPNRKDRWVLARLERGKAQRKGNSDPWIWADITDADRAVARQFMRDMAQKAREASASAFG